MADSSSQPRVVQAEQSSAQTNAEKLQSTRGMSSEMAKIFTGTEVVLARGGNLTRPSPRPSESGLIVAGLNLNRNKINGHGLTFKLV